MASKIMLITLTVTLMNSLAQFGTGQNFPNLPSNFPVPNDTPETHLITRPIPVVVPLSLLCLLYKFACSKCIKLSIEHKHTYSYEREGQREVQREKGKAVTDSSVGRTCFQQHENAL